MAGALTKYPEIDALASDYGVASKGGLRAFVNAGRPIPPLATSATDNELGCMWLQYHETNPDFQLLTLDGTTTVVRIAARKALAAVNGQPDNEPENFELPTFVDTAQRQAPHLPRRPAARRRPVLGAVAGAAEGRLPVVPC